MLHPAAELRWIDDVVGYGVFAREPIPKGTILWALDPLDRIYDAPSVPRLDPDLAELFERFTWIDRDGRHVLCWDLARYVNHSCDPNSLSPGLDLEIAVRDIARDEQICDDYATLNLSDPFECHCGSPLCRGIVRPEDALDFPRWDARVRQAFPQIGVVPQPLWPWVRERNEVAAALRDPSRIPSIERNFLSTPSRRM